MEGGGCTVRAVLISMVNCKSTRTAKCTDNSVIVARMMQSFAGLLSLNNRGHCSWLRRGNNRAGVRCFASTCMWATFLPVSVRRFSSLSSVTEFSLFLGEVLRAAHCVLWALSTRRAVTSRLCR